MAETLVNLLQAGVEHARDGVLITTAELDPPGPTILYANPAFTQITGYSAAEVIGRSPRFLQGPKSDRAVLDTLRARLTEGEDFFGETINYRKDGGEFLMQWRVSPIRDHAGQITNFVAVQRDVTAERQMEQHARRQEAELARVLRLGIVSEMAAALAHEINQPLTTIANYARGALRIVGQESFTTEQQREALQAIGDQALTAGQIVSRWKQFIAKGEPHRSTVDLRELLATTVTFAAPYTRARQARLKLTIGETPLPVSVDRVQIQQVLLNLLHNAFEAASGLEGERKSIEIAATLREGCATVAVIDAGVGMRPEVLAQAFEPYFTTKPTGLGMGLSVARTLIVAHGGAIDATSNPQHGMTFTFSLPLIKRPA